MNQRTITSQFRVPFEPKGPKLELRQEIRKAIGELNKQIDYNHLNACFTTYKNEYYDVENILFYNIGNSVFSKFDLDEISFSLNLEPDRKNYMYQYSISDKKCQIERVEKIQTFNFSIPIFKSNLKPLEYFYAIKHGDTRTGEKYKGNNYGIVVEVETPKRIKNLAEIVKRLLDGIISSFHYYDHISQDLLTLIAKSLGPTSKTKIDDLFKASEFTFLGNTKLVYSYRNGYKWNPSDEKCIAANIKQKVNKQLNEVKINGFAYNL